MKTQEDVILGAQYSETMSYFDKLSDLLKQNYNLVLISIGRINVVVDVYDYRKEIPNFTISALSSVSLQTRKNLVIDMKGYKGIENKIEIGSHSITIDGVSHHLDRDAMFIDVVDFIIESKSNPITLEYLYNSTFSLND